MSLSLRARLIAVAVGLVAAALVLADTAAYVSLRSFLLDQAGRDLAAASGAVVKTWSQDLSGQAALAALKAGRAAEAAYVVLDPGGQVIGTLAATRFAKEDVVPPILPARKDLVVTPLSAAGQATKTVIVASSGKAPDYLVAAYQAKSGDVIVVAIPLDVLSATLQQLVEAELLATVGVIVVMIVVATWLIRVGLRPLTAIERTAAAISAGDLSRRVEPADRRTEAGRLGLAINAMLERIETAFVAEKAAEARQRQLVTDAAHELRTPLTSLRGYAELFRRGAASDPEQIRAAMRGIEEESVRMAALVDDLLLLSRLAERQPLTRDLVDITQVAREAVEAARAVEPDRRIELEAPTSAFVLGDGLRLRQVVDNLLANVRIHTPPQAPAEVTVTAVDATVALEVADHGPGLSAEALGRVFERFYRTDPARARDRGGAGLGLPIVAAIVAAHGGTASVRAADHGAVFRIELPAAPATPPPP